MNSICSQSRKRSANLCINEFTQKICRPFYLLCAAAYLSNAISYIMPPIPPPAGIAGVSSLIFATADSVVRKVDATLVAF